MTRAVPAIVESQHQEFFVLDARVAEAEGQGLRARWEFGQAMLRANKNATEIARDLGQPERRVEFQQRKKFAEDYPDVVNAVNSFASWHEFVNRPKLTLVEDPRGEDKPIPAGSYAALVADPPWQYDNKSTRGAAENHYATMTIDELCELPVAERAAEDSHLYLWVTNGFIREGFDVMDAWGFAYKTCLTWVKPQIGLGNYFRSSTEHVLFGVRGKLRTQVLDQRNWFEAKRSQHSRKPDSFYDLVERCSPGPYLELFSRRRRLGWDSWGNEA